jgi:hypothetical protein
MGNFSTKSPSQETSKRSRDRPALEKPPTNYEGPSHIIIPPNSSKLSKDELIDKIKGTLYGTELFILFWNSHF